MPEEGFTGGDGMDPGFRAPYEDLTRRVGECYKEWYNAWKSGAEASGVQPQVLHRAALAAFVEMPISIARNVLRKQNGEDITSAEAVDLVIKVMKQLRHVLIEFEEGDAGTPPRPPFDFPKEEK